ncbi:hypothetical protein PUN4_460005 [Paraburkholderia unamae]|nr:hypothetical protein PUN4_460005 [Paraburkholderia unamae]
MAHIGKGPVYHAPNRNLSIGFLRRNHLITPKMCYGARIMCRITFQRRIGKRDRPPIRIKALAATRLPGLVTGSGNAFWAWLSGRLDLPYSGVYADAFSLFKAPLFRHFPAHRL